MTPKVVALDHQEPIQKAINLLAGRAFRHLPVVDGRRLVGVLSDRDVLRMFARDQDPSTPVRTIMHAEPHMVRVDTPVAEAIELLLTHRINCLPVVADQDVLVGILTTTDLLHAILGVHKGTDRPSP